MIITEKEFTDYFEALRSPENKNKLHTIIEYACAADEELGMHNQDGELVIKEALNVLNNKILIKLGLNGSSWLTKYCTPKLDENGIMYVPFYFRGIGNIECGGVKHILTDTACYASMDCSEEYKPMLNSFLEILYSFYPNVKDLKEASIDKYQSKYPGTPREYVANDFMKNLTDVLATIQQFFLELHRQIDRICYKVALELSFRGAQVFFSPYRDLQNKETSRNFLVSFPKPNSWTTHSSSISCSCITKENQAHFNTSHCGLLFAPMSSQILGMGPCDVASDFLHFKDFDFGKLLAACCSFHPFLDEKQALLVQDPDFKPFIEMQAPNHMTLKSSDKYNEIILDGATEPVGVFAFHDLKCESIS